MNMNRLLVKLIFKMFMISNVSLKISEREREREREEKNGVAELKPQFPIPLLLLLFRDAKKVQICIFQFPETVLISFVLLLLNFRLFYVKLSFTGTGR